MNTELTVLPPSSLENVGARIVGQAMIFDPDMTFEEWSAMDKQFERAEMGLGWWRGDWYNHGEDHFEEYAQVLEVNEAKKRTCQNNASVCKKYTPEERAKTGHLLSFSHHAAVAYVEEPLRSKLLKMAIGNQWSVAKLREVLQELASHKVEKEAQEDMGTGQQVNEEYIPVQLPLTVKSLGALIEDHLDPSDEETLLTWLRERLGEAAPAVQAPPEDIEPWNVHSARLIREAIEEAEAYADLPSTYKLSAERLARWIDAEGGTDGR